jgi:hypothetical protein
MPLGATPALLGTRSEKRKAKTRTLKIGGMRHPGLKEKG